MKTSLILIALGLQITASAASANEYVQGSISKVSKSSLCPVQINGTDICAEFTFVSPGLQSSIAEALSKKGSLTLSGTWKAPEGDRPQMFEISSIGSAQE